MRCPEFCNEKWFDMPTREQAKKYKDSIPRCGDCDRVMKPHSLLFDEYYVEKFNRSNSVWDFVNHKCDGLIIVGTAL